MILDKTLTFATGLDVSSTAGTALVGDVIDLSATPGDLGVGEPMHLVIDVSEAFDSGGSAIVQFALASDAQAAITTDGTETRHMLSDAFAYTELTAGRRIIMRLPSGFKPYEQYLGLLVITSGATTTAGSINAELALDAQNWSALPDAQN